MAVILCLASCQMNVQSESVFFISYPSPFHVCVSRPRKLEGEMHSFYLIVLLFAGHFFSIQAPFYSSLKCVVGLLI